ncbi:hypothetical protein VFPBJ_00446 [Purpureocillium lilacinum]|uniref:Uncharacterized protein n=1 Tax=Purpureocillium lilacinum TaxID=33203 RepID=A0A179H839_PURLI|nr:hypothetical protein VFPBJ_00446 [Purpureocillium lilacinum]
MSEPRIEPYWFTKRPESMRWPRRRLTWPNPEAGIRIVVKQPPHPVMPPRLARAARCYRSSVPPSVPLPPDRGAPKSPAAGVWANVRLERLVIASHCAEREQGPCFRLLQQ